jgi:hypothetical protein
MNSIRTFVLILTLFGLLVSGNNDDGAYDYSMKSTCTTQDSGMCTEWSHSGTIKQNTGSCFPENTYVITSEGITQMKDLYVGSDLLGYNTYTELTEFSEMPTWFHYDRNVQIPYINVLTKDGSITSSSMHNIAFTNDGDSNDFYKYTSELSENDNLIGFTFDQNNLEDQNVRECDIIKTETVNQVGMYAPYTKLHNYFVSDDRKNFYLAHSFAHVKNPAKYEYAVSTVFNTLLRFYNVDETQDVYLNPIAKSLYNIMSLYENPVNYVSSLRRRLGDDEGGSEDYTQSFTTGYNLLEISSYLGLLAHTHASSVNVNGTANGTATR